MLMWHRISTVVDCIFTYLVAIVCDSCTLYAHAIVSDIHWIDLQKAFDTVIPAEWS